MKEFFKEFAASTRKHPLVSAAFVLAIIAVGISLTVAVYNRDVLVARGGNATAYAYAGVTTGVGTQYPAVLVLVSLICFSGAAVAYWKAGWKPATAPAPGAPKGTFHPAKALLHPWGWLAELALIGSASLAVGTVKSGYLASVLFGVGAVVAAFIGHLLHETRTGKGEWKGAYATALGLLLAAVITPFLPSSSDGPAYADNLSDEVKFAVFAEVYEEQNGGKTPTWTEYLLWNSNFPSKVAVLKKKDEIFEHRGWKEDNGSVVGLPSNVKEWIRGKIKG